MASLHAVTAAVGHCSAAPVEEWGHWVAVSGHALRTARRWSLQRGLRRLRRPGWRGLACGMLWLAWSAAAESGAGLAHRPERGTWRNGGTLGLGRSSRSHNADTARESRSRLWMVSVARRLASLCAETALSVFVFIFSALADSPLGNSDIGTTSCEPHASALKMSLFVRFRLYPRGCRGPWSLPPSPRSISAMIPSMSSDPNNGAVVTRSILTSRPSKRNLIRSPARPKYCSSS